MTTIIGRGGCDVLGQVAYLIDPGRRAKQAMEMAEYGNCFGIPGAQVLP